MQLKKIQHYISEYKVFLQKNKNYREEYKWACLQTFQDNWDIEAADFGKMYDACFQNDFTRRLWKGDDFFPKEMMLKFIQLAPDFVRNMFRDLFNEKKEAENRVARFQFCCDELLKEYKSANPLTIENNHFHQENHVISMYLGFRFPEGYTLFEYPAFRATMEKFGSTKIPTPFDIARFFKVMKTLNTFLQKEKSLIAIHQKKLNPEKHFTGKTLLLANDFYNFVAAH